MKKMRTRMMTTKMKRMMTNRQIENVLKTMGVDPSVVVNGPVKIGGDEKAIEA